MQENSAILFSKNWAIYQKIIQQNYMFHLEYGTLTASILEEHFKDTPMHLLDLGCGDAQQISSLMHAVTTASYKGFDLSSSVLEFTQKNLEATKVPFQLYAGPMEVLIQEDKNTYNLIYSSYAIHHLQDEEKIKLLSHCYQKLDAGGIMIFIDIFREEGQNRSEYLNEYLKNFKQWQTITPEEVTLIESHMKSYDFPTTIGTIEQVCSNLGFKIAIMPKSDRHHCMLVLRKN